MDARYSAYLQSDQWNQRRIGCFLRAGKKCEGCHEGGRLQAHHLTYARIFAEPLSDLMALCRNCHKLAESLVKSGHLTRDGESDKLRIATRNALQGVFVTRADPQPQTPIRKKKKNKKTAEEKKRSWEEKKEARKGVKTWAQDRFEKWQEARKKHRPPPSSLDTRYYNLATGKTPPKLKY